MKRKLILIIFFLLIGIKSYSQPNLISPLNNSNICPGSVLLDWENVQGAISYRVQVWKGVTLVIDVSGLTESQYLILAGILEDNTQYYWRINFTHQFGTSGWSSQWLFTTLTATLSLPLVNLINGGNPIYPNNPIIFKWRHVPFATSYRLQVASINNMQNLIIDQITTDTLFIAPPWTFNANSLYYWRVAAVNTCVQGPYSTVMSFVTIGPSGIKKISQEIPAESKLFGNYPNPFNPSTKIKFSIVSSPRVSGGDLVQLKVYDVMGREVQALVNESVQPGTYEVTFDGSMLNSGVYFYKLTTESYTESRKMLLIK